VAIGSTLIKLFVVPFTDECHWITTTEQPTFALPSAMGRRSDQFEHDIFGKSHAVPFVVSVNNDGFKLILMQSGNSVCDSRERLVRRDHSKFCILCQRSFSTTEAVVANLRLFLFSDHRRERNGIAAVSTVYRRLFVRAQSVVHMAGRTRNNERRSNTEM